MRGYQLNNIVLAEVVDVHMEVEVVRRRSGDGATDEIMHILRLFGPDAEPGLQFHADGTLHRWAADRRPHHVGECVFVASAVTENHVAAGGVRVRPHLGRGGAVVDADVGEARAEPGFHVGAGRIVEGPAGGARNVMIERTLRRGLLSLLLAAADTELMLLLRPEMPGLPKHLHNGAFPTVPCRAISPCSGGPLRVAGLRTGVRAPSVPLVLALSWSRIGPLPTWNTDLLDTRRTPS
jgi:hypothetical protein